MAERNRAAATFTLDPGGQRVRRAGGSSAVLRPDVQGPGGSWFDIYAGDAPADRPLPTAAYPDEWDGGTIEEVRTWAERQNYSLRWHMSVDTWGPDDKMEWDLYVVWQGLNWSNGERPMQLIDEAMAFCEVHEPGYGWKLYAHAAFGHAYFPGGVGHLPVHFDIRVLDDSGDVQRSCQRNFVIGADGSRERW